MLKSIFIAITMLLLFSAAAQASMWVVQIDIASSTTKERVTNTQPGDYVSKVECDRAAQKLLRTLNAVGMKVYYVRCVTR